MSILNAIFRYEGKEELINLEDISKREDYELVKENLFCSFEGCYCPLQYIAKGAISEYLKRRIGELHNESCTYFTLPNLTGHSRRIVGTSSSILRDDHVASILRGLYDVYTETTDEREVRLKRGRENARVRRNNKIDKSKSEKDVEEVYVNKATTSSEGESLVEGERNPPVRRRYSLLDLSDIDIGQTEGIIGELVSIVNNEKRTILELTDRLNKITLYVYLEEVFFDNSPVNIDTSLKVLSEIVNKGKKIYVSCVGEVVYRDDKLGMLLLREKDLRINRVPVIIFIHQFNE
ncbi:hypothetical protein [Paenibacillus sp. UMB4589-SE434]|uniref:hypothetical protein n=1 Tax=Paenibacillus sp. UMB4589-SE434 TaxID=3046314 RepID=UPI00254F052D|nr:hypothetical protein [Paenibacillus sp. UMB4589-SE434]MDK8182147.1 hypothetical protein [Paenibacillus sp. UMB4589-SE434]